MSAKTSMTIRTDADVKLQAQHIFTNLGMDMSTAINLFLRQAIKHQGLPFDVNLRTPNATTMKAIADKNMNGPFDSVSELMDSLDA
jgi:DNA-damage-inducible protein J